MLDLNNTFLPLLASLCLGGLFEKTRSQPHIYKDLSLQVSLKTIKSQPFFNASSSISRDFPSDPGCIALNDPCDEPEEKDNCCDGLICWIEKPGVSKCMPAISRCLEVSPMTRFYSNWYWNSILEMLEISQYYLRTEVLSRNSVIAEFLGLIVTSSTINKKLAIYDFFEKGLENFEFLFLSMVDELHICVLGLVRKTLWIKDKEIDKK